MAQVVYNGNGSDGGSVPVNSNTYTSGTTVNVADNDSTKTPHQQTDSGGNPENVVTGNLSRTGATFLYWEYGGGWQRDHPSGCFDLHISQPIDKPDPLRPVGGDHGTDEWRNHHSLRFRL